MKKLLLFAITTFISIFCFSQTRNVDSLKKILDLEKDPVIQFTIKSKIVDDLITKGFPVEAISYINQLYQIATQLKSDSLLMLSYYATSRHLGWKTDTKEEIEYRLKALDIADKKYPEFIPSIYNGLGSAYNDLHNSELALTYLRKAIVLMDTHVHGTQSTRANIYFQLSDAFNQLKIPDSALHYAQKANEYYLKTANIEMQKTVWTSTARAYAQLGNHKMAESYLLNSIDEDPKSKTFADATAAGEYSKLLLNQNRIALAKYYGLKGLDAAISSQSKFPLLYILETLRKTYEAANQTDSAYYFSKLELSYRDSLFNQDRLYAIQNLTFKEQVRQQEDEIKKAKAMVERNHNLQFAGIAIGIITFLILFFTASRSIIVNERFINFFGILGLLAVFEFINLYIHPILDRITNHSPVLMLAILMAIAGLLIPLHHKLEKWITKIMVQKNKKIRLEAARKTIEKLEGEPTG